MLTILHGANSSASRNQLAETIKRLKQSQGEETKYLSGKTINLAELRNHLEAIDLFGAQHIFVIERLLLRPKSNDKKVIIEYLCKSPHLQKVQLILWEDDEVTKTQLKPFEPTATIQVFALSSQLFSFLQGIVPNNTVKTLQLFHQTLSQEDAHFIFLMLIRQMRLLVSVQLGSGNKLPAWQRSKLMTQAKQFELNQLIQLHRKLLEIDTEQKTGKNQLELIPTLDLYLAGI